ncbi:MAG: hypothetical protein AAF518_04210 [Spirochaetota bacterium]
MQIVPRYSEKQFLLFIPNTFLNKQDIYEDCLQELLRITLLQVYPEMQGLPEILQNMQKLYGVAVVDQKSIQNTALGLEKAGDLQAKDGKWQIHSEKYTTIHSKYTNYAQAEMQEIAQLKKNLQEKISAKLRFRNAGSFDVFWQDFYHNFILATAEKILYLYQQLQNISVSEEDYYTELQSFLEDFFSRYSEYKTSIQSVIIAFIDNNPIFLQVLSRRFYEYLVWQRLGVRQGGLLQALSYQEVELYIESVLMVMLQIMSSVHKVEEVLQASVHPITSRLLKDSYQKSLVDKQQKAEWQLYRNQLKTELASLHSELQEKYSEWRHTAKDVQERLETWDKHQAQDLQAMQKQSEDMFSQFTSHLHNLEQRFIDSEQSIAKQLQEIQRQLKTSNKTMEDKFILYSRPKVQSLQGEIHKVQKQGRATAWAIAFLGMLVSAVCYYFFADFNYTFLSVLAFFVAFVVYYTRSQHEVKNRENQRHSLQARVERVKAHNKT